MEKISGIIPASARVKSVDPDSLSPVRPGAPGFGRPEGSSEIRDRVTLSSATRQAGESDMTPNYKVPKDLKHQAIADRVAQDFFASRFEDNSGKSFTEPDPVEEWVEPSLDVY